MGRIVLGGDSVRGRMRPEAGRYVVTSVWKGTGLLERIVFGETALIDAALRALLLVVRWDVRMDP